MWQVIGRGLVICAALVVAASFGGALHGIGDSLAVFRPVLMVGALCVCALVWRWRFAQVVAVATIVLALAHSSLFVWFDAPSGPVNASVYQKNMLYLPRDRAPLEADVRQVSADVVTLQEVSGVNLAMLAALRDLYPYQHVCRTHSVGATAVLSQTPLTDVSCSDRPGFARAVTQIDGTPVQVFSVHLHWPWPFDQQGQVADLEQEMTRFEGGKTIVGGDFNMVVTGRSIAWIGQATQTQRVGRRVGTFDLFGYPLGIDHVLATGGIGALDIRPFLGADHRGVVASIEWPID